MAILHIAAFDSGTYGKFYGTFVRCQLLNWQI